MKTIARSPEVVVRRLPLNVVPERLFRRLFVGRPYPFWLDSAAQTGREGRYSIMGADPFLVFSWKGPRGEVSAHGDVHPLAGNPLDHLGALLRRFAVAASNEPRSFAGGAIGFFAYDLGRHLETLPERTEDDRGLPDCCLGFYEAGIVIDHQARTCSLSAVPVASGDGLHRLDEWAAAIGRLEGESAGEEVPERSLPWPTPDRWGWNRTPEDYVRMVAQAQSHIAAGDIYQVNLSQRLSARWPGDPLDLYRRLRRVNPAPYAAYLGFSEAAVLSASPELFLRLEGDRVVTRPIKGTRPRHQDPHRDAALREELLASPKDQAELLMIVDLERNDLGRVCRPGSVAVPKLACVESHPRVHHLVATVTGRLAPGMRAVDLLRATFPGGSITGAPKVRAMELIESLEPVRRGIYTGAIGCLSFTGDMTLSIAIRTLVCRQGRVDLQVGGGIVADSVPELEYQETLHKARGLLEALGLSAAVPRGDLG